MRSLPLVAAVCALTLASACLSDEHVVYIDTRGDLLLPDDDAYLRSIVGTERKIAVSILSARDNKPVKVSVSYLGDLDKNELERLLQPILAQEVVGSSRKYKLVVIVKGGKHRVSVLVGTNCGPLCGGSVSHLYTYDGVGWHYLYSYNHLIS